MHFTYDCCRVVNACKVMQQDHEQGSARQHISCFLWSCAFSCFFAKEHRLAHLASFFFFFWNIWIYIHNRKCLQYTSFCDSTHGHRGRVTCQCSFSRQVFVSSMTMFWVRFIEYGKKKKSHFPAFVLLMLLSASGCYTRDFYVAKYYGMG